jgi:pimeloyl-ACP methyl ester carboxylesterase
MPRAAHHATAADGTPIYWTSTGRGSPAVVLTDGIGCAGYIWRALRPALAEDRRVVHWHYRAHGASGIPRNPARMTLVDCVEDLRAVLDDAREQRVVVVGHSMGVQVALELHRRHPRRVAGLVLALGAPGRLLDTFRDSPTAKLAFPWARDLILRHPELARVAFRTLVPTEFAVDYALEHEVDHTRVDRADMQRYFDDLAQVDPTLFVRLLASASEHDATEHLPKVDVPTLVIAGERDTFTPKRLSAFMHREIRGSHLLVVPGGTHVAILEEQELVARTIREFLAAEVPVEPARRAGRSAGAEAPLAPSPVPPGRRPRTRR